MEWNIRHCDCVRLFQICLKNLNSSLSNEVALLYSLNARECYSEDHPNTGCTQFEHISDEIKVQLSRFMKSSERETYFKRCVQYALDKSQPKRIQIIDAPFNDHAKSTVEGMSLVVRKRLYMYFKIYTKVELSTTNKSMVTTCTIISIGAMTLSKIILARAIEKQCISFL